MSDSPSDGELLARWRDGDAAAGGDLVRRHNRSLCLFLLNKVGASAVDDLSQSVYEVLLKKSGEMRETDSVKAFLFGIARMKVLEHYRVKRKMADRYGALENPVADAGQTSATQRVHRGQQEMLVVLALRKLPLDDQILLEMSVDLGMTREELAQSFGVSMGQIGGRIHRARQKLASFLAEFEVQPELVETTKTSLASYWRQVRA